MRFIRGCIFLFLLLCFCIQNADAQKWLWANAGINNTGASGADPQDIATDDSGNVFETGNFKGSVNFGTVNLVFPGVNNDAFLVKFNNNGLAQWGIALIGSGFSSGISVATNKTGDVWMSGYYTDTMNIGSFHLIPAAGTSAFIARISSAGVVLWAANSQNNSNTVKPNSVCVDDSGNAYVTGYFIGAVSFGTFNFTSTNNCTFLVKYDVNGNVVWATSAVPNTQGNSGATVIADTLGNIYLAGQYSDSLTFGSTTITSSANQDIYLAKFNSSGNVTWISTGLLPYSNSYANLTSYEGGRYLSMDKAGNLIMAGTFRDTLSLGIYTLTNKDISIFIVKYSPSGNVIWANAVPKNFTSPFYAPCSVSCNKRGGFFLSGTYQDSIRFNSIELKSDSLKPSFLFKFDSNGTVMCGTTVENNNDDNNCVAADPMGHGVFFSGDILNSSGSGNASCAFDSFILTGHDEFAFLANWFCSDCNTVLIPTVKHTNVTCSGDNDGTASFSVSNGIGPYEYIWSPSVGTTSKISNLSVGTYTITCTDYNGCQVADSVTINQPVPFSVNACCNTSVVYGDTVQLSATGGTSYQWTPSIGLSCDTCPDPIAHPAQTTTYSVFVRNDSSCSEGWITIEVGCGNVFVPNAFSPNQDGHNDRFFVRGVCISNMHLAVYDRWGNCVFETYNIHKGWDGTYKGVDLNVGTYLWYLNATLNDGTSIDRKGSVTLIR